MGVIGRIGYTPYANVVDFGLRVDSRGRRSIMVGVSSMSIRGWRRGGLMGRSCWQSRMVAMEMSRR